jgi:pimeloyl-ACP methyl ester carboxylesterase
VREAEYRRGVGWAGEAFIRSIRGLVGTYVLSRRPAGRRSMWTRMRQIQAPTLVVWGVHDKLVNVRLAPLVASTIPDARLLVLPDGGHVSQMEHPDVVARAVVGLLEDAAARVKAP